MSEEEAEARMEALQYLKQNPRHDEANQLQLLRGERLYEQTVGADRMAVGQALMEFEAVLSKQDRTEIERARKKLERTLNDIEYGRK